MPWQTPSLRAVRELVRDAVNASLPGADANVPNSVLRVLSDNQGALCHLTLQYVDWLSLQLLPDTAETEWLDRHGQIWLVNADGSTGRKMATLAIGSAQFQGIIDGTVVPAGTQLQSAVELPVNFSSPNTVATFETLEDITTSASVPVTGNIRAVDAGSFGNLPDGSGLSLNPTVPGVISTAFAYALTGGTDTETDDELRARILQRIRNPPMGGAQADYVSWALAVPGVTRAWANVEQGIGTMTVRFMMDDLRADNDGFPLPEDIATVGAYIDKMRPVTVKDCFVAAPIKYFLDLTIADLNPNTDECKAEIEAQLKDMLFRMAAPGQTIFSAWISAAIMKAPGVISLDLVTNNDFVMPNIGSMADLGTILYE
ncbi:baseplate J/gp47 family protein [Bradyrhizobium sp. CCGUVB1N3]|uniref:baseplate J/gp47 family protein n=1 Tax=Bradyrhizobium sp. CCGUVB1N3 TaxID=2949629 RepID=UPI0020B3F51B|nr:baseplate J/gp47 family protein [Bradyrhizobium sp. CCGUVB1N3]MCP3471433.1 baseplate J/gp47 family protein [Bradyrhizobium sp. CCGUVB1N3]MCP3472373.1 baseplate J/gp47 family protein [Bradyrhizobium sp. CCGUVB1N3]